MASVAASNAWASGLVPLHSVLPLVELHEGIASAIHVGTPCQTKQQHSSIPAFRQGYRSAHSMEALSIPYHPKNKKMHFRLAMRNVAHKQRENQVRKSFIY